MKKSRIICGRLLPLFGVAATVAMCLLIDVYAAFPKPSPLYRIPVAVVFAIAAFWYMADQYSLDDKIEAERRSKK